FAAKHDKYRYDDIDRYSTTLTEQRFWAREIVKAFAQAIDFVLTGRKKPLRRFKRDPSLRQFDLWFDREREYRTLWRVGFAPQQIETLRRHGRSEIGDLRRALSFFEDIKVARGMAKLSDGINHAPVFLIRNLLRELPAFYMDECGSRLAALMEPQRFCRTMAASYASRRDLRLTPMRRARVENFQKCYQRLLAAAGVYQDVLPGVRERSAVINYQHRMTGNGVLDAVEKIAAIKDKLRRCDLLAVVGRLIESQVLIPGQWKPIDEAELGDETVRSRLLRAMQSQLEANQTI
ncbi:MAG: hypothetical protein ABIP55_00310, partial [Tepidisphaeraceae bacterium]